MDKEARLVYIRSQILCAEIEMQGMIAENRQRELRGESMAYVEEDFALIPIRYGIHSNAVISYLKKL